MRAPASRLDTGVQVPIAKCAAIHFKVILVSRRHRHLMRVAFAPRGQFPFRPISPLQFRLQDPQRFGFLRFQALLPIVVGPRRSPRLTT